MHTAAIIPAAGFGLRLKNKQSKPLITVKGIPIIVYTLKAISKNPNIKEIIIAANPFNIQTIKSDIKRYRFSKVSNIVLGGNTRRLSVENALGALSPKAKLVLIHDAVRPLIREDIISKAISQAMRYGASVVGVPVKATIKKISIKNRDCLAVEKTIDRSTLYEIQTPQVFRRNLILKAYRKFKDTDVTDDSVLVEKLGLRVSLVLGSYDNIKITTPEDLLIVQQLLKRLFIKKGPQNI